MKWTDVIRATLVRDLDTLDALIRSYPREEQLWVTNDSVRNSAGTLALHLAGNLRAFIGRQLGDDGYVRDRDGEFSRRDVPRSELLAEIKSAREVVNRVLSDLDDAAIEAARPELAKLPMHGVAYLLQLTAHLSYHVGQIDYHRRFVAGVSDPVGAMRPNTLNDAG